MNDDRNHPHKEIRARTRGSVNAAMPTSLLLLLLAVACLTASCSRLHMSHTSSYPDEEWSTDRRARHAYLEMRYFAEEMDWVARQIEEWGTLGISSPMVVREKGQFAFDPGVTAKELYDAQNRTEGAVSLRTSRAVNVSLDVDAASGKESETTADAGATDPADGAASADSGSGDAGATGGGTDPPARPANAAAEAVGDFSESLGTFDSSKLVSINPRRRIRLTASDFWELNLHKFFALPEYLVGDYVPIFITFTVSCRPGWRTSSDFVGVVETRVEYMYPNEKGDLVPFGKHVADETTLKVAGLYPAYDSQELNLRNSQRELRTFAGQLAAKGELVAAKLFLDAAEKREQDAETNTGLATVTGYASSGQGFGYEFRPTFRALSQPGNRKTKPGFRLEPISFPAVAVALVDADWLRNELRAKVEPKIRAELGKKTDLVEKVMEQAEERVLEGLAAKAREELEQAGATKFQSLGKDAQQSAIDQRVSAFRAAMTKDAFIAVVDKAAGVMADEIVEQRVDTQLDRCELVFQTSHTWRPLKKPFATDIPVLGFFGRLFQPRLSEWNFVERLSALSLAFEHFDKTFCTNYEYDNGVMKDPLVNRYACESLRNRWAMLGSHAVNFDARIKLKAKHFPRPEKSKEPKVVSVHPGTGWQDAETFVVIHGKNFGKTTKDVLGKEVFDSWVKRVVIGGVDCTHVVTGKNTVVATVQAGEFSRDKLKHDVTVVTSEGTATARGAIEFVARTAASTGTPAVTVTRDDGGRVMTITVNPDAIDEERDGDLLKSIRAILENENCCENIEICIKKGK